MTRRGRRNGYGSQGEEEAPSVPRASGVVGAEKCGNRVQLASTCVRGQYGSRAAGCVKTVAAARRGTHSSRTAGFANDANYLALTETDEDAAWEPIKVLWYRATHDVIEACRELAVSPDYERRVVAAHILGRGGYEDRAAPWRLLGAQAYLALDCATGGPPTGGA